MIGTVETGPTFRVCCRVDRHVLDAARERLGLHDASDVEVTRHALALAGGLDPEEIAPMPMGRGRARQRRERAGASAGSAGTS